MLSTERQNDGVPEMIGCEITRLARRPFCPVSTGDTVPHRLPTDNEGSDGVPVAIVSDVVYRRAA